METLSNNILGVSTGAFVAGAFLYIFGGTRKETGQTLMIGAIIGYVIVKMAGFIFGMVLSFVS